jgi:hypothetical protein
MECKCKRIIDGKTYNTETATKLAGWDHTPDEYPVTTGEHLYQNRFGAFFLFSYQDDGPDGPESDIKPLSRGEARAWLERHQHIDVLEGLFGRVPEAGETTTGESKFTLRMPDSLTKQLAARAKAQGLSLNAWIVRCLETYALGPSGHDEEDGGERDIPPMGGLIGSNRTGWATRRG